MVAGSYCVWFGSVFVAMVFTDVPSSETLICGLPLYINLRLLSTDKGLCIIDSAGLATGFWDIRMHHLLRWLLTQDMAPSQKCLQEVYFLRVLTKIST